MSKKNTTIVLVIIFLIGLGILLYPTVADYVNSKAQSRAIVEYEEMLKYMKKEDYTAEFDKADEYNRQIHNVNYPFVNFKKLGNYKDILNITGTGMMGYITIDKIGVELPIYHGTSDKVLNMAVGHLQGSSLPIGGDSTHCILSTHRGLPSARLFTDIDKLEIGDTFILTVLNKVMAYKVDRILVVEPDDISALCVEEGRDFCTLVTCTPYGINTHRLLVRGIRTELSRGKSDFYIANDAYRIDTVLVTPVLSIPMLTVLLIILSVRYRKRQKS